mgnify:CR=1 FL=1
MESVFRLRVRELLQVRAERRQAGFDLAKTVAGSLLMRGRFDALLQRTVLGASDHQEEFSVGILALGDLAMMGV